MAIIGAATWIFAPQLLPGTAANRAKKSTSSTAAVIAAVDGQGAAAAAGVTAIGHAAADVPASPATEFIRREVPAVLAKLPTPDPVALLEAEKRRAAIMEGKAELANQLYEREAKKAAALQRERDEAIAARRSADLALETAAAAEHARTMQALGAGVVALLAGLAWLYLKFHSASPATLGRIAADIRAGVKPIDALDVHLPAWLHPKVNKAARLATPPPP